MKTEKFEKLEEMAAFSLGLTNFKVTEKLEDAVLFSAFGGSVTGKINQDGKSYVIDWMHFTHQGMKISEIIGGIYSLVEFIEDIYESEEE